MNWRGTDRIPRRAPRARNASDVFPAGDAANKQLFETTCVVAVGVAPLRLVCDIQLRRCSMTCLLEQRSIFDLHPPIQRANTCGPAYLEARACIEWHRQRQIDPKPKATQDSC